VTTRGNGARAQKTLQIPRTPAAIGFLENLIHLWTELQPYGWGRDTQRDMKHGSILVAWTCPVIFRPAGDLSPADGFFPKIPVPQRNGAWPKPILVMLLVPLRHHQRCGIGSGLGS